ncbi:unnamed protein product [Protopolystoma xenopodis]|uniref:Uncharacterized protein n=1 Tax=Protopolystoma xenopodis TaxID=117903 RepID=A0A3S5B8G9_9PLAT|nr:unnamed protein product [Protopolystoma xenopodis]
MIESANFGPSVSSNISQDDCGGFLDPSLRVCMSWHILMYRSFGTVARGLCLLFTSTVCTPFVCPVHKEDDGGMTLLDTVPQPSLLVLQCKRRMEFGLTSNAHAMDPIVCCRL